MPTFIVRPASNVSVAFVTEANESLLYVRFSQRAESEEYIVDADICESVASEIHRLRQLGKALHRGVVVGTDALLNDRVTEGREKALTILRDLFAVFEREQLPVIWRTRGGISGPLDGALLESVRAGGDWLSLEIGVPTLDEKLVKALEGRSDSPVRDRIRLASALHARGIPVRALIDPLVPMLTDAPAELEALLKALEDAGVHRVSIRYLVLTRDRQRKLAKGLSKMQRALIRGCFQKERWRKPNAKAAGAAAYQSHKLLPDDLRRRGHDRITAAAARLGIAVVALDPARPVQVKAKTGAADAKRPQLDLFGVKGVR